jgi:putative PIN family toxin of toxin-antitoxin system
LDLIAMSLPVLAELRNVLSRPKIARQTDPKDVKALFDLIMSCSLMFEPRTAVTDCRDPTDNKYLELALEARARTIISSDADLLVLSPWRSVAILTPAEYLAATAS